jgi:hypothetical protein
VDAPLPETPEEMRRELQQLDFPDCEPRAIKTFLQRSDVRFAKAPGEISGRRRIGNPFGAQPIEITLILSARFNIFQALSAGQNVVGHIQHMITLVIGQVDLQQLQAPIQILHQSQPLHH